ncbi:hypothetical protein [Priestia aryabhattai]
MDAKDLVDVLVEQNKTYKEMMQFAITSIITLLVIFLAANFFVMRKMRKDEIERIQAEVKSEIVNGIQERILPDINEKLSQQMDSLVKDRLRSLEETTSKLNRNLDNLEASQNGSNKAIRRNISQLRADIEVIEGDLNIDKNNRIAFTKFVQAIHLYISIGSTTPIKPLLTRIEAMVENIQYVDDELTKFLTLSKELENIFAHQYQHQCNKIIKVLKSKEGVNTLINKYNR